MNPLFFVIIPFYNVQPYLKECIQSVLNQTYRNFKVILIDDGSTDEGQKIAREFLHRNHSNKICLITQENKGVSSARNAGITRAIQEGSKEDFIVFVDSDDVLNQTYLDSIIQALNKHPDTEVFIGNAQTMSEDGKLGERGKARDCKRTFDGMEYLSSFSGDYPSYVGGGGSKN